MKKKMEVQEEKTSGAGRRALYYIGCSALYFLSSSLNIFAGLNGRSTQY